MTRSLTLLASLTLLTVAASAQVSLVTTPGFLAANDSVSWGQLGANDTEFLSPAVAVTANLATVTVSHSGSALFARKDQILHGWTGNFSAGEKLLWNGLSANSAMKIDPAQMVFGAGFQIQDNSLGAFTAQIQAFGSGNTLLGTVTRDGMSTNAGDGSALFIGFSSTLAVDYFMIQMTASTSKIYSFAINTVQLRTTQYPPELPPFTPVPEPATYGLFGAAALAGLGFLRRRRQA